MGSCSLRDGFLTGRVFPLRPQYKTQRELLLLLWSQSSAGESLSIKTTRSILQLLDEHHAPLSSLPLVNL